MQRQTRISRACKPPKRNSQNSKLKTQNFERKARIAERETMRKISALSFVNSICALQLINLRSLHLAKLNCKSRRKSRRKQSSQTKIRNLRKSNVKRCFCVKAHSFARRYARLCVVAVLVARRIVRVLRRAPTHATSAGCLPVRRSSRGRGAGRVPSAGARQVHCSRLLQFALDT